MLSNADRPVNPHAAGSADLRLAEATPAANACSPEILKLPLEKYAAIISLTAGQGQLARADGATFCQADHAALGLLALAEIKEVLDLLAFTLPCALQPTS
jgi:hypothetical protein